MAGGIPQAAIFPALSAIPLSVDSVLVSGMFPSLDGVPNTSRLAIWTGSHWTSAATAGATGPVLGFSQDPGGIVAVGTMDSISGIAVNGVARFDGSNWTNLCAYPSSSEEFIYTSSALFASRRIVAGNFNNISIREIGWLDLDTVRQLGPGILGESWVNSLHVFEDALYVAGQFQETAGNAANNLVVWNGTDFSNPFPQVSFTTQVVDLTANEGEIFISGRAQLPASSDYYTLGRYDGERLCLFGKNLNTIFLSIAASEEHLYVAPNMNTLGLGGDTVNYIARWDLDFLGDTCIQIVTSTPEPAPFGAGWSIGPSPLQEAISITSDTGIPMGSHLELVDAAGRLIQRSRLMPAAPNEKQWCPVPDGPQGVVVACIRDAVGTVLARQRLTRFAP